MFNDQFRLVQFPRGTEIPPPRVATAGNELQSEEGRITDEISYVTTFLLDVNMLEQGLEGVSRDP